MESILYKKIIWDYDIPNEELERLISGEIQSCSGLPRETVLLRMLQRLSWEELVKALGHNEIKNVLETDMYKKLRDPLQRIKYEQLLRLLQGKALSFSGWDPENRERIRATLLSNRWDRT